MDPTTEKGLREALARVRSRHKAGEISSEQAAVLRAEYISARKAAAAEITPKVLSAKAPLAPAPRGEVFWKPARPASEAPAKLCPELAACQNADGSFDPSKLAALRARREAEAKARKKARRASVKKTSASAAPRSAGVEETTFIVVLNGEPTGSPDSRTIAVRRFASDPQRVARELALEGVGTFSPLRVEWPGGVVTRGEALAHEGERFTRADRVAEAREIRASARAGAVCKRTGGFGGPTQRAKNSRKGGTWDRMKRSQ